MENQAQKEKILNFFFVLFNFQCDRIFILFFKRLSFLKRQGVIVCVLYKHIKIVFVLYKYIKLDSVTQKGF